MSTGPSQPLSTPFSSQGYIEPSTSLEENIYDTIEVSQPVVHDAKRHYEACLAVAAGDTEEGPPVAGEKHYRAINNIHNLEKESFHAQIVCERHELIWTMGHCKQENPKQLDTEPDEAWKDTLRKSIKHALLPLTNDVEMDYGTRFAAAEIEDAQKLSKEYVRNIKRLKRLADEWFEAQLSRERQERMKIIELSKQSAREKAYLSRDESPLSYQELRKREEEVKRKGQDLIRKDEAIKRKEEEIRQREDALWKREQELRKGTEEAKQRKSELMLKEKTLRKKEEAIRLREEAARLWEETLQEETCWFKGQREEALPKDESLTEDRRLQRAERVEPRRREQELCQDVPSFGGQREKARRKDKES